MLHLYHNETFECLQSLSVVTPLARMKNGEYRPEYVILTVDRFVEGIRSIFVIAMPICSL